MHPLTAKYVFKQKIVTMW